MTTFVMLAMGAASCVDATVPSKPVTATAPEPSAGQASVVAGAGAESTCDGLDLGRDGVERPQQRRAGVAADERGDDRDRHEHARPERRAPGRARQQVGVDRDIRRRGGRQVAGREGGPCDGRLVDPAEGDPGSLGRTAGLFARLAGLAGLRFGQRGGRGRIERRLVGLLHRHRARLRTPRASRRRRVGESHPLKIPRGAGL